MNTVPEIIESEIETLAYLSPNPLNTYSLATKTYVVSSLNFHDIDYSAHELRFQDVYAKIGELSGDVNHEEIYIKNDEGEITNKIRADLSVSIGSTNTNLLTELDTITIKDIEG